MNLIEKNIDKVRALCDKHKVSQLYVFGSVLGKQFDSESDIDLIVTFKPIDVRDYADNYFDFKFSLKDLFKYFNRRKNKIMTITK